MTISLLLPTALPVAPSSSPSTQRSSNVARRSLDSLAVIPTQAAAAAAAAETTDHRSIFEADQGSIITNNTNKSGEIHSLFRSPSHTLTKKDEEIARLMVTLEEKESQLQHVKHSLATVTSLLKREQQRAARLETDLATVAGVAMKQMVAAKKHGTS